MIQFNLLPDVKLEFIKAERTKRLVTSVATLASVVSIAIFLLLLLIVDGVQKKNLSDLDKDIKSNTSQLSNTPNLNKILTVQSQLDSLPALHDQKPIASRLFQYLGQVTPSSVTISNVQTDFDAHTITITGQAANLDAVNTLVDTLKFTNYTSDKSTSSDTKAFTDVVLSSFDRTDTGANYTVTFTYDPAIFDAQQTVSLKVPVTVTTRSVTEQPNSLFKENGE